MKDDPGVLSRVEPEQHIPEGMEERQNAERAIGLVDVDHLRRALDVGVDAEMGEHHALWLAGAAAAENNCRKIVHAGLAGLTTGALQETHRSEQRQQQRDQLLAAADRLGDVFEPQNRGALRNIELRLLNKLATGEHGLNRGLCDG